MDKGLPDTRPFARFEWMLAGRYLRARRREGFISVISLFSFLGILLGVATLIVVMAVLNGFRAELLDKILGFQGHVAVYRTDVNPIPDYEALQQRLAAIPGVTRAVASWRARPWPPACATTRAPWCAAFRNPTSRSFQASTTRISAPR
jgi:lipoprotein-releasing system permease protein